MNSLSLSLSRFAVIFLITFFTATNLELAFGDTMLNQTQNSTDFVRSSCNVTLYPRLCFNSLEHFAAKINGSSMDIAHVALAVSLIHLNRALVIISGMPFTTITSRGAIKDCIDNIADSVDEMKRSMREFRRLSGGNGDTRFKIGNIQTWLSAALTDEDTCLDGFDAIDGSLGFAVRRMMRKMERLTSNSLALFNRFANEIMEGLVY